MGPPILCVLCVLLCIVFCYVVVLSFFSELPMDCRCELALNNDLVKCMLLFKNK